MITNYYQICWCTALHGSWLFHRLCVGWYGVFVLVQRLSYFDQIVNRDLSLILTTTSYCANNHRIWNISSLTCPCHQHQLQPSSPLLHLSYYLLLLIYFFFISSHLICDTCVLYLPSFFYHFLPSFPPSLLYLIPSLIFTFIDFYVWLISLFYLFLIWSICLFYVCDAYLISFDYTRLSHISKRVSNSTTLLQRIILFSNTHMQQKDGSWQDTVRTVRAVRAELY